MERNDSTVAQVAERDRCWAELRDNEDKLAELVKGKKNMDPFDFMLFHQCIAIVLTEIALFEEEFLDVDKETKKLIEDRSAAGALMRTLRETGYWKDMVDKKLSNEKRSEAIQKLRKSMWANMVLKKEKITQLMDLFPQLSDIDDMHVLMQCAAMVGLELNLKEREIDLLY